MAVKSKRNPWSGHPAVDSDAGFKVGRNVAHAWTYGIEGWVVPGSEGEAVQPDSDLAQLAHAAATKRGASQVWVHDVKAALKVLATGSGRGVKAIYGSADVEAARRALRKDRRAVEAKREENRAKREARKNA